MGVVDEFLVEDIGFENGHGTADDDHILAHGFDERRDELMLVAHLVEDVAHEGGEEFFACDAEEFGIIFPKRHIQITIINEQITIGRGKYNDFFDVLV